MTIRHDPNFVSTAFIYVHTTFIHPFMRRTPIHGLHSSNALYSFMRYIYPFVVSHLFISFHVCAIPIHESHSSTHSCATFAYTLHCTHSSLLMYQPHRLIPPWPIFSSITYHIHGLIRSYLLACIISLPYIKSNV